SFPHSDAITGCGENCVAIGVNSDNGGATHTLEFTNVIAGNTNTAGNPAIIAGSQGTGTGVGGSITFKTAPAGTTGTSVNPLATVLTLDSTNLATFAGQLNVAAMTQTSTAQSGTICYNSGTGAVTYDATLGCLTSSLRFKHDWEPLVGSLDAVMKLQAGTFLYNDPTAAGGGQQIGLNAENMVQVEPDLVGYAPDGQLLGVRYQNTVALLVGAIQELQSEVADLKAQQGK